MARSAATAVQFPRVDAEAKLALVEFLLPDVDLQTSARRAIDWLSAHADVQQRRRGRRGARRPVRCCSSPSTACRRPRSSTSRCRATTRRIRSITRDAASGEPRLLRRVARSPFRSPLEGARSTPCRCGPKTIAGARSGCCWSARRRRTRTRRCCGWRGSLGQQVSRLLEPADARRDAVRSGADAALQHHQRRHRPDPADRHRRPADHRQRARRDAVRRARGGERRAARAPWR